MTELAAAFVRIRPSIAPEHRGTLEELAETARALADGIDSFLTQFADEPAAIEKETQQ